MKTGLLDDLTPAQVDGLASALEAVAADFPQIEALANSTAEVTPELGDQLTRWLAAAKTRLGSAT